MHTEKRVLSFHDNIVAFNIALKTHYSHFAGDFTGHADDPTNSVAALKDNG